MKILYFYQYFSTSKGSWGTRVYEFSKEWVNKGHEVTVVTSVYSKSDLKAQKIVERQKVNGINVIILNIKIDNKQHPIKRIWTFILYSTIASWFAITENYDIVISSSGPITVGIPGLIANLLKQKKFVFEVRDLWPDTAISMGFIKYKFVQKLMYRFEKFCYDRSDLIITLSPGSKENIINRYENYNIISVPNSANIELFQSTEQSIPSILEGKNYAVYTGNIGPVNNSKLLFEAAKLLSNKKSNICIVLIGDGQQKEELLKGSKELKIEDHFLILDLMPKENLVPIIQNSIASLIPLANKPLLDTSSPNKLFESLAAGVPIIQTTNGWIKNLLRDEECGFTVSAYKANDLVDKLLLLNKNKELRKTMSYNSFKVAKSKFDKNILSQRMINSLESL